MKVSASFLVGVATSVGVFVTGTAASLLGGNGTFGDPSDNTSTGHIIQYVLVGLLVALAIKDYVGRETAEPPTWLGALQQADSRLALKTRLLVILLMPSDIIMLTVGVNLVHNNLGLLAALPFVAATVLIAALPLMLFLLFHRRAADDAEGARLDELPQLAGQHYRLRRVYRADPRLRVSLGTWDTVHGRRTVRAGRRRSG